METTPLSEQLVARVILRVEISPSLTTPCTSYIQRTNAGLNLKKYVNRCSYITSTFCSFSC